VDRGRDTAPTDGYGVVAIVAMIAEQRVLNKPEGRMFYLVHVSGKHCISLQGNLE
jgi:hypothetical protein